MDGPLGRPGSAPRGRRVTYGVAGDLAGLLRLPREGLIAGNIGIPLDERRHLPEAAHGTLIERPDDVRNRPHVGVHEEAGAPSAASSRRRAVRPPPPPDRLPPPASTFPDVVQSPDTFLALSVGRVP